MKLNSRWLLLSFIFALAGCMSTPVRLSEKWNPKDKPSYEDYFDGYVLGLAGPRHEVALAKVCMDQKPYAFQRLRSAGDAVIGFVTLGIYTPITVRVWCGD